MKTRAGALYAVAAYSIWGVLPVYWKWLRSVPSFELLSHRIVWSLVFLVGLLLWKGKTRELIRTAGSIRALAPLALTGTLIGSNWLIYITAVNSGHIMDASLGYFISPLLNVFLGAALLKESLRPLQWAAVLVASVGVLLLSLQADHFPWISLALAGTFGFYGLARKQIRTETLVASAGETLVLVAPALLWISYLGFQGNSAAGSGSNGLRTLLILGGAFTALPLLWFTEAARRLPLSTLGFFQYLSPTLQFALAFWVYHEPFSDSKARAFALIWTALLLYSGDAVLVRARAQAPSVS